MQPKLRLLRVVTSSECVPWHLGNTLIRSVDDFEVCVVGDRVSLYHDYYPRVLWKDIPLARKISPLRDMVSLIQLCWIMYSYKPHIVHSIMPKAGLLTAFAGFICRVPVRIHTFTGQVWATKRGASRQFLRALDRLVVYLNTLSMTDSPSQSKFLENEGIIWAGGPLPVLSKGSLSGVDISRFRRSGLPEESLQLKEKLGLEPSDFVFAFIARKTIDKGALDILSAFASLSKSYPNAWLLFVGPDESGGGVGNYLSAIRNDCERIINIDRVPNHEVYLGVANVLCLPSYREGFGSIVIDAAAMGIPAIGSRIPGLVDAIEDGKTGFLFPPGDLKALELAMRQFIEYRELAVEMGSAAKKRIDRYFTADILYESLKSVYMTEINKHRVKAA